MSGPKGGTLQVSSANAPHPGQCAGGGGSVNDADLAAKLEMKSSIALLSSI